jgi:hypothetical protein
MIFARIVVLPSTNRGETRDPRDFPVISSKNRDKFDYHTQPSAVKVRDAAPVAVRLYGAAARSMLGGTARTMNREARR